MCWRYFCIIHISKTVVTIIIIIIIVISFKMCKIHREVWMEAPLEKDNLILEMKIESVNLF